MRWLFIFLSLLGYITSASASSLTPHISAEPEHSFKTSGIYWLPDYLQDNLDRNARLTDDDGGKDVDRTCSKYNSSWQTTIGADMECDAVKPLPNLTCYKNCRCKNVVSVGTGEQCNRYCLGSQCVSKSCKAGVSVGSGETCTEKCASNSGICTAKRCNTTVSVGTGEQCTATCGGNCVAKSCKSGVSVAAGETCTERCASNSNICTAKSCNATVSVGVGEQCNTTCGGNCVAKSCKGSVSVGTGETCTQRCASNSGICTAKSCKSTATLNTGEYCTERCAADNSCTAKACKSAVSVGVGETCSEHCSSNTNTCTAKKCNSAVSVNSSTEVCTQTCASDASVCTAKRAKTCAERSMKDCNGSCIATSECCGGCPTGQSCQSGSCVSSETCRKQAEAKGYQVIETAADLDLYADTAGNKLVVNGVVEHSGSVNINRVDIVDAKGAVGGLCTQEGALKLNKAYITGTFKMGVPLEVKNLYMNKNFKGLVFFGGSTISIDSFEITAGTADFVFNSPSVYAKQIDVKGSSVMARIQGNDGDVYLSGQALPMEQRYPAQFDEILVSDGSTLNLGGGMGLGSLIITGVNTKRPTVVNIDSSSAITIHPMRPYNDYSPFSVMDCQNQGCLINFGSLGNNSGKINFNDYGIDYLVGSSSSFRGASNLPIRINNFELYNFGAVNTGNYARPVDITFSSTNSQISWMYFYISTWLGAQRSNSGTSVCNVTVSSSLSRYSGCNYGNTCSGSCWEERY